MKRNCVLFLFFALSFAVFAQEEADDPFASDEAGSGNNGSNENDPFAPSTGGNENDPFAPAGGGSDDPFAGGGQDADDPFADEALIEEMFGSEDDVFSGEEEIIEELPESDPEDGGQEAFLEFLTSDEVQVGGDLRTRLTSNWFLRDPENIDSGGNRLLGNIRATVYLNARPESNLRIYMSTRVNFPFSNTVPNVLTGQADPASPVGFSLGQPVSINTLNLSIYELYTDVNFEQAFFLRFGKQTVNWGVGRFWSPADIISLVPIDPQFPDDQREGPLAIKATVPFDLSQIDAYLIVPTGADSIDDVGVAARGNFFFDLGDVGLEWQLGFGYQRELPWRIMTTFQLPLRGITPFIEARVSFGREGQRIVSATQDSSGRWTSVLADDNTAYFSGTIGFNSNFTNIADSNTDIFLTAQYYLQGEGYSDSTLLPAAIQEVALGNLNPNAIQDFGQHYTALSFIVNELFYDGFSVGIFWQANWSDLSGSIRNTLTFEIFEGFSIELALTGAYGDDIDQYVAQNFFAGPGSRFAFALTTIIGGGQF